MCLQFNLLNDLWVEETGWGLLSLCYLQGKQRVRVLKFLPQILREKTSESVSTLRMA